MSASTKLAAPSFSQIMGLTDSTIAPSISPTISSRLELHPIPLSSKPPRAAVGRLMRLTPPIDRVAQRRRLVALYSGISSKPPGTDAENSGCGRYRQGSYAWIAKAGDGRNVPVVPTLEEMHGYGDAKAWGLELARDIEDWRDGKIKWEDVDNGALISGPPGCGKTTFAPSLARTLGAHFIGGSYSSWLGTGGQRT